MIDFTSSISTSQVGGHTVVLKTRDGHLLKPVEQNIEAGFYSSPPATLIGVMPAFYAFHPFKAELMDQITAHLEEGARENTIKADLFKTLVRKLKKGRSYTGQHYLGLLEIEDITAGMSKPCVLDIKVSFTRARGFYPEGSTICQYGFLLSGMQYFKPSKESPTFLSKVTMLGLNVVQTREKLQEFFSFGSHIGRSSVVTRAITKSAEVASSLLSTNDVKLRCASLLLAYDADFEESMRVKLIDFGKVGVVENTGPDGDLVASINSFIKFLEEL